MVNILLAVWLLALCSAMMKTDIIDRKLSVLGVVSWVALLIAGNDQWYDDCVYVILIEEWK